MKYLILMLCGMLTCAVASAQTDSTYLDLGRIRARKEFTQTTVIKASDLAQMPFTDLSDAIRLWVNGANTDKSTMAYVVDGVMINDADAYSIYDIEEITIVQNALSQANGAGNLQTLALITTKKGKSTKPRFSFAGQAFVVDRKVDGKKNNFNFFNQYNFTGSANIGKVTIGGSTNFLHDEMPVIEPKEKMTSSSPDLNRFRLHVWATTNLGKKSQISVHANYTPQFAEGKYATTQFYPDVHSSNFNEYLVNTTLQLQTAFSNVFHNKFSAGYTRTNQKGTDDIIYDYSVVGDSVIFNQLAKYDAGVKGHTLFFNDNISYGWALKDWSIEPALNVNFQSTKFNNHLNYMTTNGGLNFTAGSLSQNGKGNFLTIAASVAISYKNIFHIQGGFMQDVSTIVQKDYDKSKAYPFLALAVNVLPENSKLSWKVYGSFAKTFPLNNFSQFQVNDFASYDNFFNYTRLNFSGTPPIYISEPPKNYDNRYQVGTDFSFLQKRVLVGYNYLNMAEATYASLNTSTGNAYFPGKYSMERHQISATAELLQNSMFKWRTGLFVNLAKNKLDVPGVIVSGADISATGGWTNRFAYQRFSVGVDLLYQLGGNVLTPMPKTAKYNTLLLQNVYVAYAIGVKKHNNWNVYISSRNLVDSNIMPLAIDNRKFYGAGVKFDF